MDFTDQPPDEPTSRRRPRLAMPTRPLASTTLSRQRRISRSLRASPTLSGPQARRASKSDSLKDLGRIQEPVYSTRSGHSAHNSMHQRRSLVQACGQAHHGLSRMAINWNIDTGIGLTGVPRAVPHVPLTRGPAYFVMQRSHSAAAFVIGAIYTTGALLLRGLNAVRQLSARATHTIGDEGLYDFLFCTSVD